MKNYTGDNFKSVRSAEAAAEQHTVDFRYGSLQLLERVDVCQLRLRVGSLRLK